MSFAEMSREQILEQAEALQARLGEAEETLEAIRTGGVDALVSMGPEGEQVFTLEGAEHPYRVVVELMNEGVATMTENGGILYANTRLSEMLRVPLEHLIGSSICDYILSKDKDRCMKFLSSSPIRSGAVVCGLRVRGHKSIPARLSARALDVGGLPAICVVVTDLTDMFAAAETETRYASILETSHDAIIANDLDGVITTWNTGAERTYGHTAEEAVGRHISLIVPPEYKKELNELMDRVRRGERVEDYRTIRVTKSGKRVHISLSMAPIHSVTGRLAGFSVIGRDITVQQQAEAELAQHRDHLEDLVRQRTQELRRSERTSRAFFENMHEFAAMFRVVRDEEGLPVDVEYIYANPPVLEVVNKTSEQIIGRRIADVLGPGREERVRAILRVAETGEPIHDEMTFNGRHFLSSFFLMDEDTVGAVSIDITEKNRAENRLRKFFDSGMVGVIYWTTDGRITEANDKFLSMVGYTRDELRAGMLDWVAMTPDEYKYLDEKAMKELMETGVDTPYEKEYICKDGRRISIIVGAALLDDPRHEGVAFVLDIADRKRFEEALRRSEAQFRETFDHAPIGMAMLDLDGRFLHANPAYCEIVGYDEQDLLRGGKTIYSLIHPDDIERNAVEYGQLMSGKVPAFFIEKRYVTKSCETVWVRASATLRRDESGRPVQVIGIIEDITGRKYAEDRLRITADELARSNKDLEDFAYVVSHDLQEPLRQIVGFSDLLEQRYHGRLEKDGEEFLDFIIEGGKRMQSLIHDLLTYSRVGREGGNVTTTSFNSVIDSAMFNLQMSINESAAVITRDEMPTLTVDASQFVQVFQNLIGNAIKFRGDSPPLIHVGAQRIGDKWQFTVSDNGIGFPQDASERIFQVFQRLHARRKYAGTGIGLAICKRVVEQHGGRIWAKSTPGQGATFYFTVPEKR